MKKIIVLIFVSLLSLQISAKDEPKRSGIINFLIGKATITRNNNTMKARQGAKIYQGDVIKTENKSQVDIYFGESSVIKVMPNSSLTVTQLEDSNGEGSKTTFFLKIGKVFSSIGKKLSKNDSHIIKTDTITAAVRGTEFMVEAEGKEPVVACTKGSVNVTNDTSSVIVKEGQEIPIFRHRRLMIRELRKERRAQLMKMRREMRSLRKEYRSRLRDARKLRRQWRRKFRNLQRDKRKELRKKRRQMRRNFFNRKKRGFRW